MCAAARAIAVGQLAQIGRFCMEKVQRSRGYLAQTYFRRNHSKTNFRNNFIDHNVENTLTYLLICSSPQKGPYFGLQSPFPTGDSYRSGFRFLFLTLSSPILSKKTSAEKQTPTSLVPRPHRRAFFVWGREKKKLPSVGSGVTRGPQKSRLDRDIAARARCS